MAIAKMKKFTLLTFAAYKSGLLKELQRFEDVHFKNLQQSDLTEQDLNGLCADSSAEEIDYNEAELEKVKFTMNKLEPYVVKPKGVAALTTPPKTLEWGEFDAYPSTYDYQSVHNEVQAKSISLNSSKVEIAKLKSENENLRSWMQLDVSPAELDSLKFVKCVIGTVNKLSVENLKAGLLESFPRAYMEIIGSQKDEVTAIVIAANDESEEVFDLSKSLGFSRATLGFKDMPADAVSKNNKRIEELEAASAEVENGIKALAGEYDNLKIVFDYYETVLERERARNNFLKTDTAVAIEGWVPVDDLQTFRDIIKNVCGSEYYLEEQDVPLDSEDVPIKLKNNKFFTAFEGITETFSMPKYNDVDPTPLFAPFYFLYFGFMLGDAGYGLILIAATWAALKFCNFKPSMRRFIKFFFFLGFSTIFAGIIYGSAFGQTVFTPITMADGTRKAILDSQLDVVTMMLLSVGIGVFQMLFGLAIKGYVLWRNGDPLAAIFDAGFWIISVASGLGWLIGVAGVLPPSVSGICMWIFFASLLGLAATQGRASKTVPVKIVSGIYSVYGMTSYIGDLVSYTRIAALALSGAYISFAFNIMAKLFPAGPIRIVFGTIVFLIGLLLNLGLSALGAYVHTLRLQYVEFFGKFYEGGGVPFNPFKLNNKYIKIKE